MKIILTGGGSGGHFYPLISVADKIRELAEDKNIVQPNIYYLAEVPYNEDILFKTDIKFLRVFAGKLRLYFSLRTILDILKTAWGVADAIIKVFQIYPDVVFTNGGYVSFPVVMAAKLLRIPVVIHVSDTVPSRVLLFAGKFAKKISIAFPEAAKHFDEKKVAHLGNPIRDEIKFAQHEGSHDYFNLDPTIPTILILGGSQGSQIINDTVISALPELVEKYNIIHQVGKNNYDEAYGLAGVALLDNPLKRRYRLYPYLDDLKMKMSAGIADLIVTRAGAGSINEIANWAIPSILIPISKDISRDQTSNSLSYARAGAALIIRQKNLGKNVLVHEINRLMNDKPRLEEMRTAAKKFFVPDADKKIARAITEIVLSHQK